MLPSTLRSTLLALCSLTLLFAASACQSEGPNAGVTVGEIEADPSQYFGQQVTVSGDIDDRYTSSFTIGGEGFGGELLIIVPSDAQISGARDGDQPYRDDDIVQVTGTVRQYVIADLESDLGLTLDPAIEYEEQDPAVVAQSIAVTPRESSGRTGSQMRDVSGQMRSVQGQGQTATDPAVLIGDPTAYAGRTVDFDQVTVNEVISDSTFWISDGSDGSGQLFVFLNEQVPTDAATEGRYDINQGQTISLQGSLRRLPSMEQVNQRLNLDDEMQSMLQEQEYYLWAQQASGVPSSQGGM